MTVPQPHHPPIESASIEPPPPYRPYSGAGATSLTFSFIAPASMFISIPMSLLAALLTRPDMGAGSRDWVAPAVLWSLPVLFGLISVSLGIRAVRASPPGSNSWTAAVSALWISGLLVFLGLLLVIRKGDFMILF